MPTTPRFYHSGFVEPGSDPFRFAETYDLLEPMGLPATMRGLDLSSATKGRALQGDLKTFQSLVSENSRLLQGTPPGDSTGFGVWGRIRDFISQGLRRWQTAAPAPFLLMAGSGFLPKGDSDFFENSGSDRVLPISIRRGQTEVLTQAQFMENRLLEGLQAEISRIGDQYVLQTKDFFPPIYRLVNDQWRQVFPSERLVMRDGMVLALGSRPTRADRTGFAYNRTTALRWKQQPGSEQAAWILFANASFSPALRAENQNYQTALDLFERYSGAMIRITRDLGWTERQRKNFFSHFAANPKFLMISLLGDRGHFALETKKFEILLQAFKEGGLDSKDSLHWAHFFAGQLSHVPVPQVKDIWKVIAEIRREGISDERIMRLLERLDGPDHSIDGNAVEQLRAFQILTAWHIEPDTSEALLIKMQSVERGNSMDLYRSAAALFARLTEVGYRGDQAVDLLYYVADKAHWSIRELEEEAIAWMPEVSIDESLLNEVVNRLHKIFGIKRTFSGLSHAQALMYSAHVSVDAQIRLFKTVAESSQQDAAEYFRDLFSFLVRNLTLKPGKAAQELNEQVVHWLTENIEAMASKRN